MGQFSADVRAALVSVRSATASAGTSSSRACTGKRRRGRAIEDKREVASEVLCVREVPVAQARDCRRHPGRTPAGGARAARARPTWTARPGHHVPARMPDRHALLEQLPAALHLELAENGSNRLVSIRGEVYLASAPTLERALATPRPPPRPARARRAWRAFTGCSGSPGAGCRGPIQRMRGAPRSPLPVVSDAAQSGQRSRPSTRL